MSITAFTVITLITALTAATFVTDYPVYLSDSKNRRGLAVYRNVTNYTLCDISIPFTLSAICEQAGMSSAFPLGIPYFNQTEPPLPSWIQALQPYQEHFDCYNHTYLQECDQSDPPVPYVADERSGVICPLSRSPPTPVTNVVTFNLYTLYLDTTFASCNAYDFLTGALNPYGWTQELATFNVVFREADHTQVEYPWCGLLIYAIDGNITAANIEYFFDQFFTSPYNLYLTNVLAYYLIQNATLLDYYTDVIPPWAIPSNSSSSNNTASPDTLSPGSFSYHGSGYNGSGFPPFNGSGFPGFSGSGFGPGGAPHWFNTSGWKFRLDGGVNASSGVLRVLPPDQTVWGGLCMEGLAVDDLRAICGSLGFNATYPFILPSNATPAFGVMYLSEINCVPGGMMPPFSRIRTLQDNCTATYQPYGSEGQCTTAMQLALSCSNVPSAPFAPRSLIAVVPDRNFSSMMFQSAVGMILGIPAPMINVTSTISDGYFKHVTFHFQEHNASSQPPSNSSMFPSGMSMMGSNFGQEANAGGILVMYPPSTIAAIFEKLDPFTLLQGAQIYELSNNITTPNGAMSFNPFDWKISLVDPTFGTPSTAKGKVGRLTFQPGTSAAFGTICSQGTSLSLAASLCNAAGVAATTAMIIPHFSAGTGPIYISNMTCLPSVPGCTNFVFSNASFKRNLCTHGDDVGLFCGVGLGDSLGASSVSGANISVTVTGEVNDANFPLQCLSVTSNVPTSRFTLLAVTHTVDPWRNITTSTILSYRISAAANSSDFTTADILLVLNVTDIEALHYYCGIVQLQLLQGGPVSVTTTTTAAPPTTLPSTTTTTPAPASSGSTTTTTAAPASSGSSTTTTSNPSITSTTASPQGLTTTTAAPSSSTKAPPSNSSNSTTSTTAAPTSTAVATTPVPTTPAPTLPPPTQVAFQVSANTTSAALISALATALNISPSWITVALVTNGTITLTFANATYVNASVALANNNSLASIGVAGAAPIQPTWAPNTVAPATNSTIPDTKSPTNSTAGASPSSGPNVGVIVGAVVGSVAFVIIAVIIAKCVMANKANKGGMNEYEDSVNQQRLDDYIAMRAV